MRSASLAASLAAVSCTLGSVLSLDWCNSVAFCIGLSESDKSSCLTTAPSVGGATTVDSAREAYGFDFVVTTPRNLTCEAPRTRV